MLAADLTVEVATPDGETATGHLTGSNGRLRLDIDNPGLLAGSGDSSTVRSAAEELAAHGITVEVVHDGVHLVTLGAVSAPWWQRRATGSRRIKVGSWRGAWTSLRSRATQQGAVLPTAESLPPPTMLPLTPTFSRHPRRRVTTTHTPSGSGSPRLVLKKEHVWDGERQPVFWLSRTVTTIGSSASCDIVLSGIEPLHAVVLHDDADEYVLESCGPETRVHGGIVESSATLRTGARIDVGPHSLSFYREEYADHGRPHGGREGGEIGHQRSQPPRPSDLESPDH
ncbi:MAG: FHA domain-containing protein [Marmoricola sp.]